MVGLNSSYGVRRTRFAAIAVGFALLIAPASLAWADGPTSDKPVTHKSKVHAVARPAAKSAVKRHSNAKSETAAEAQDGKPQVGIASWYGKDFNKQKTASGEKFSPNLPTAAHRTLPIGTHVKVTNLKTGQSTTVRVNDRGPYKKGRVIDLSQSAAKEIGLAHKGVAKVKIEVVGHDDKQAPPAANNAAVKQQADQQKAVAAPAPRPAPSPTPEQTAQANEPQPSLAAPVTQTAKPAQAAKAPAPDPVQRFSRRW